MGITTELIQRRKSLHSVFPAFWNLTEEDHEFVASLANSNKTHKIKIISSFDFLIYRINLRTDPKLTVLTGN